MAFNVGAFVKDTAKSALDIITGSIVNNVTAGLNRYSITSANSTAQSLIATGATYATTSAIAAQTCDAAGSRSESSYYALAGKDVAKTAGSDITKLRQAGAEDVNNLLQNVVPATKISSKKADKAETIMAVL